MLEAIFYLYISSDIQIGKMSAKAVTYNNTNNAFFSFKLWTRQAVMKILSNFD